jgi:hypothetical protein
MTAHGGDTHQQQHKQRQQRQPASVENAKLARYLGQLTDSTRTLAGASTGTAAAGKMDSAVRGGGMPSKSGKKSAPAAGPDLSAARALLEKLQTYPEVKSILDGLGVGDASDLGLLDEYDLACLAKHCPKVTFHKLAAEWSEQRAGVLLGSAAGRKGNRSEVRAATLERLADALVEEAEAQAAHEQRAQEQREQEQEQQRLERERERKESQEQPVSEKIAALRQSEAVRRARAEAQRTAAEDAPAAAAAPPAARTGSASGGGGDGGVSPAAPEPQAQLAVPAGVLRSTPANRKVARAAPSGNGNGRAAAADAAAAVPAVGKLRASPAKRGVVKALPAQSGGSRASPRPWDESVVSPPPVQF